MPQALPQAPQLASSLWVFTQVPQAVSPVGHWHCPSQQAEPAPQALPQAPQLVLSFWTFTQEPLQAVWPVVHVTPTPPTPASLPLVPLQT